MSSFKAESVRPRPFGKGNSVPIAGTSGGSYGETESTGREIQILNAPLRHGAYEFSHAKHSNQPVSSHRANGEVFLDERVRFRNPGVILYEWATVFQPLYSRVGRECAHLEDGRRIDCVYLKTVHWISARFHPCRSGSSALDHQTLFRSRGRNYIASIFCQTIDNFRQIMKLLHCIPSL